ncbi:hypothetical protein [Lewinella sp. 4G2]|uniref:hypothetical protein n=1 Tax=Lewinella sp. 4G2 TaxID=1803372 RepID=UPI0007B4C22D|nr:hypothetical protein [Lewinella sp. 4G2]OAV44305.1 hypothetical protein A3850_007275 [Lewinella sp. 4G2]
MENNQASDGIITFRDLVHEVAAIGGYLLRKWYVVLLFVVGIASVMVYIAVTTPSPYIAQLTFSVAGAESEGFAGGGVLAQLGLGGTQSSSGLNLARLQKIAKSRIIVKRLLFTQVSIDGKEDFIANHLINLYDLRNTSWKDNPQLSTFQGFSEVLIEEDDLQSNIVLKSLAALLTSVADGEPMILFVFDEFTGIHQIEVRTPSQELSARMAEIVYSVLDDFYVENSIAKQQGIVDRLQERTDSIQTLVMQTEATLASSRDRGNDLVLRRSEVGLKQLERQLQINTAQYLEIIKNLELARYTLNNITPSFQIIDLPIFPLGRDRTSPVLFGAIGAIIGLIISVTCLVVARAVRNAMKTS